MKKLILTSFIFLLFTQPAYGQTVKKSELDIPEAEIDMLLMKFRAVAVYNVADSQHLKTKHKGFHLLGLTSGNIIQKLGLRSKDTVMSIAGKDLVTEEDVQKMMIVQKNDWDAIIAYNKIVFDRFLDYLHQSNELSEFKIIVDRIGLVEEIIVKVVPD